MNIRTSSLNQLSIGQKAVVTSLNISGIKRRRMLDLGLIPGTHVEALHKSPSGDPVAYYIRGSVIALRTDDAKQIEIKLLD